MVVEEVTLTFAFRYFKSNILLCLNKNHNERNSRTRQFISNFAVRLTHINQFELKQMGLHFVELKSRLLQRLASRHL